MECKATKKHLFYQHISRLILISSKNKIYSIFEIFKLLIQSFNDHYNKCFSLRAKVFSKRNSWPLKSLNVTIL